MDKNELHEMLDAIASKTCQKWKVDRSDTKRLVLICKNEKCIWSIGVYLNKNGWNPIRNWKEEHVEGCPYSGESTHISPYKRRLAASTISKIDFPSKEKTVLLAKILSGIDLKLSCCEEQQIANTAAYIRRKNGLTRSMEEANFVTYLSDLETKGFEIKKEKNYTLIKLPFTDIVVKNFYSPLFIDATGTSDKKTITHITGVSTTNKIILLGLAMSLSENSETVTALLKFVIGDVRVGIVSDEGTAMKSGIASLGEQCSHMLCLWHLAKQMPNEIILDGVEYLNGDAKNILYDAARGTAFPYNKFVRALSCDKKLLEKLDRIKSQWCRRYSNTLRRDFIATVSEALNGTVKRYALDKSQVRLVKAFIRQGMKAYRECCEESAKLEDNDLMPLARRYYDEDLEVSGPFFWYQKGNEFDVYYDEMLIAHVIKDENGHYNCDCGQDRDIGTPCSHILSIEEVKAEDYTHNMWTTNVFKETFKAPTDVCISHKLPKAIKMSSNQSKIIAAVKLCKTISNETTKKILDLLKKGE